MKKLLARMFMAIGMLVVLSGVVTAISLLISRERLPESIILEVDFEREYVEYVPQQSFLSLLREQAVTLRDILDALQVAGKDSRVKGLVARIGNPGMGLAEIQELRDAIIAFRATGRTAIGYAETFGEFGPGNGAYYLASAFDQIFLQPSGDLGLTGLMAQASFFSGTLEKVGVRPRMERRHEYKNALNIFTESKFTPAHREAVTRIIESQFSQIVRGIAGGRQKTREEIRALVDRGPFLASQALEEGLIDGLAYRDEVYEIAQGNAGHDVEPIGLLAFLRQAGFSNDDGPTIALIYGVGGVQRGRNGYSPALAGQTMGSDSVSAAFRAAVRDDDVRAILFRVDSPGGSYVASDTIWRETVRARQAGKPVVVSMGNVAGSGGYFVAAAADKIVAQPGTITGSIGVIGGKIVTKKLMERIGVTTDEVHTSKNAAMWTNARDYTPEEWTIISSWLDHVYEDFTQKVAEGRGLTVEQVHSIAKGRVWTGEDAKGIGLVDELGGFPVAINLAKEAAEIGEDEPIRLKLFPPRKNIVESLISGVEPGPEDVRGQHSEAFVRLLESIAETADTLGILDQPDLMKMQLWKTLL